MRKRNICLFGGTGFVGKHLANELYERGHRIKIFTRRADKHRELLVVPSVRLVEIDLEDEAKLEQELRGTEIVINLLGTPDARQPEAQHKLHVDIPVRIAKLAQRVGVVQMLHVSAAGAALDASNQFLRTKAEGERRLREQTGDALPLTVFRPSIIFGPGDHFMGRFIQLLRRVPLVFPLPRPQSQFAPVYVGDVVLAMALSIDNHRALGQSFCLSGPRQYSLRQIVALAAEASGHPRWIMGLSDNLSRLQARVWQRLPGAAYTLDNDPAASVPSICPENHLQTFFNLNPLALETVLPFYAGASVTRGRFDEYRRLAGREDLLANTGARPFRAR